jgi:hypothetical protein
MAVDNILKRADSILSSADEVPNYQELEQNMLINFLERYAPICRSLNPKGFRNFVSLESRHSSVQFSNINSKSVDVAPFIDYGGHPILVAARTPNIRIYKVFRDDKNKAVDEVEIPLFLYGTENILDVQDRSTEAYFKGLSFDLKDQTAYGASRMVKSQLTLGFNSFAALNKQYVANSKFLDNEVPFSYVDLLRRSKHRTVNEKNKTGIVLDPTEYYSYSLRMEIGWNHPASQIIQDENLQAAAAAGVEFNHIVLLLELEDYDLEVQQNGLINLTLNYYSYMEREVEKKISYNVFYGGGGAAKKIAKYNESGELAGGVFAQATRAADGNLFKTEEEAALASDKFFEDKITELEEELRVLEGVIQKSDPDLLSKIEERVEFQNSGTGTALKYLTLGASLGFDLVRDSLSDDEEVALKDTVSDFNDIQQEIEEFEQKRAENAKRIKGFKEFDFKINKVDIYSSVMARLIKSGKVFYTQVETKDLMMFSPKYAAALKEAGGSRIKEADLKEGLRKKKQELAKEIVGIEQQFQTEQSQDQVKDSIIETALKVGGVDEGQAGADQFDFNKATSVGLSTVLDEITGFKQIKGRQTVYFMYFGDLIKHLSGEGLLEELNEKKIGIILGNVSFSRKLDLFSNLEAEGEQTISVNLGDIPISIEYFSQFFAKTIVDKGYKRMSIFDFIRGLVNQCVVPALNLPIGGIPVETPVSAKTQHILMSNKFPNMYESLASYEYGRYDMDNDSVGALEAIRTRTDPLQLKLAKTEDIWNYMYVYGTETKNITGLSNNVETDMKRGVYHFTFGDFTNLTGTGNRTDLIKDIKFVKVKKSGQREMMVERNMQGGNIDSNKELWNTFDVEMTMIGNNLLHPGKHIYVNAVVSGFGRTIEEYSILSELGMGGYYLVTDVSNEINETGEWVTSVKAAWQSNGFINVSRSKGSSVNIAEKEAIESGKSAPSAVDDSSDNKTVNQANSEETEFLEFEPMEID